MVDDEVGRSSHYTPAASSISTSPCRMATSTPSTFSHTAPRGSQQKRRRISRGEELDDAICEGLRESSKKWERKAEAEAAEKNAEMYFGKNVGETLRLMTPRQKAIAKATIQQVLLEVEFSAQQSYQRPLPLTILEHIQIMNYKIYYYNKNYRLFITTWYKFTVFAVHGCTATTLHFGYL